MKDGIVMVAALVAIVVLAVVIYLGALYFQRLNNARISAIEDITAKIEANSQEDELAAISKLNLTGESLAAFEELDKSYRALINRELPFLVERLKDVKEANQHFSFPTVKSDLETLEAKGAAANMAFTKIIKQIKQIKQQTNQHQQNIDSLQTKYQEIRKKLLAKNFSYGPAITRLEAALADLEKDFKEYENIAENGDYVKADKALAKLKDDTKTLEVALKQIPPIYQKLHNVYPDQLTDLKDALAKMQEEKYLFKEDMTAKLADLDQQSQALTTALTKLDLETAKLLEKELGHQIEAAYTVFEEEYTAREKVEAKTKFYADFIEHAEKQERRLSLELDRLGQNYTLNNDEKARERQLAEQLKEIHVAYTSYQAALMTDGVIYSQIWQQMEQAFSDLKAIEEEQGRINDGVANLWKEEKQAWEAVNQFNLDLAKYRRDLEKLNLPGLQNEYLDYYYRVKDEVEAVYQSLDHVKIDMAAITKDLIDTQADLDALEEKTKDIVDSSSLTEEMLQYSNRYRNRYPEVAQAYQQAKKLFSEDYDYVAALDTIAQAVDKVEPGAYDKVSARYHKRQQGWLRWPNPR